MHWCQINHNCTFMQLHEVNTNESLESLVEGVWGEVANRCQCLLSIAIAVKSGTQQKQEKERSQWNFVVAQRVRTRFYMELKNITYFIALCRLTDCLVLCFSVRCVFTVSRWRALKCARVLFANNLLFILDVSLAPRIRTAPPTLMD